MDAVTDFLHRMGVPAWMIAIVASVYIVVDKTRPWSRKGKSEREILSMEEQEFRLSLSHEIESMRREMRSLHADLVACNQRHADCEQRVVALTKQFNETLDKAKAAFLEFLVKSAPANPDVKL